MEGRHEARENVEDSADGDSESLSSDDSGSEKSLSDVEDAIYRDENGEDATLAAGVAGAYSPGISRATTPVPTPELREREREQKPRGVVAWMDLPEKAQLTVITLARLSEPLTQTSIQVSSPPRRTLTMNNCDAVVQCEFQTLWSALVLAPFLITYLLHTTYAKRLTQVLPCSRICSIS